jgi:hypothetical protein
MTYDPQRSHRRPRLAEEAPPPVDALLEGAPTEPERRAADVTPTASDAPTTGEGSADLLASDAAPRPLPDIGPPDGGQGARRAIAVALLLALVLSILLWRRRRRRR